MREILVLPFYRHRNTQRLFTLGHKADHKDWVQPDSESTFLTLDSNSRLK